MNPVQLYRLSLANKNSRTQVDKLAKRIAALAKIDNPQDYPWQAMTCTRSQWSCHQRC